MHPPQDGQVLLCGACVPFIAIKFCEEVEATTLLAKALLHAVLQQRGQLQVLLADPVALVVLLLH